MEHPKCWNHPKRPAVGRIYTDWSPSTTWYHCDDEECMNVPVELYGKRRLTKDKRTKHSEEG